MGGGNFWARARQWTEMGRHVVLDRPKSKDLLLASGISVLKFVTGTNSNICIRRSEGKVSNVRGTIIPKHSQLSIYAVVATLLVSPTILRYGNMYLDCRTLREILFLFPYLSFKRTT